MAVTLSASRARRAVALVLVLCSAFASTSPLCAQEERPSVWAKLRGSKPKAAPPQNNGPLRTLARKLVEAKTERQQAAKLGADPADLHRMDARIAGIEELGALLIRRQEMVRDGQPRTELAQLDERILEVRQALRRVPRVLPNQGDATGTARFDARTRDLWSTPRGNRASSAYPEGALRRSMGI